MRTILEKHMLFRNCFNSLLNSIYITRPHFKNHNLLSGSRIRVNLNVPRTADKICALEDAAEDLRRSRRAAVDLADER